MRNGFSSARLEYHRFTESDFNDYCLWYMNPEVMQYIGGHALTLAECEDRFRNVIRLIKGSKIFGIYKVYISKTGEYAGIAKIAPYASEQIELGYGLFMNFRGLGYAREMLKAMIDATHQEDFTEYIAMVHPDNYISIRILEKEGFCFSKSLEEKAQATLFYTRVK